MLAVELTSLEALSPPATGRRHNHCTSGGAPLELWYWVSSSLCETLLLSCDSGTNRLAIWTESSHDFRNEIFF